jgi:hypothetical protein
MEAYQWFLLGIMVALIPCLVILALVVRRATRHRELGANPSVAVAVDRAADLRRQAEILTRISKTISKCRFGCGTFEVGCRVSGDGGRARTLHSETAANPT